eukprot:Lankesteria_metandrocarpae@DN5164_c0_g1_i4.p1
MPSLAMRKFRVPLLFVLTGQTEPSNDKLVLTMSSCATRAKRITHVTTCPFVRCANTKANSRDRNRTTIARQRFSTLNNCTLYLTVHEMKTTRSVGQNIITFHAFPMYSALI